MAHRYLDRDEPFVHTRSHCTVYMYIQYSVPHIMFSYHLGLGVLHNLYK